MRYDSNDHGCDAAMDVPCARAATGRGITVYLGTKTNEKINLINRICKYSLVPIFFFKEDMPILISAI